MLQANSVSNSLRDHLCGEEHCGESLGSSGESSKFCESWSCQACRLIIAKVMLDVMQEGASVLLNALCM